MTPFRDNGHLTADQRQFNYKLSSVRQTVERCIRLLKGRWRKLTFLDHLDIELMVLIIISACVLHNFCLIHDDFDEGYFGDQDEDDDEDDDDDDDDDGGHGLAHPLLRRAQQKRLHIMGMLH